MSSRPQQATPTRPWQEVLLSNQQRTNNELLELCAAQQELLHQFDVRLSTREERNKSSLQDDGATGDSNFVFLPNSKPVIWGGKVNEAIPVDMEGERYTAMIFTPDMIDRWNDVLKLNRRLNQCTAVQDRSIKYAEAHKTIVANIMENMRERGKTPTDNPHFAESLNRQRFVWQRYPKLQDIRIAVMNQLSKQFGDACCKIRHFLESQGRLADDDYKWLAELREGDSDEMKQEYEILDYDPTMCPFESRDLNSLMESRRRQV